MLRQKIIDVSDEYGEPVHLVGHSMGGLMVRAALNGIDKRLWQKIGRIVFIGTPHYGSPSIAGYLKNHLWGWEELAIIGMFLDRETFRSLRGVLLPAACSGWYLSRDTERRSTPMRQLRSLQCRGMGTRPKEEKR